METGCNLFTPNNNNKKRWKRACAVSSRFGCKSSSTPLAGVWCYVQYPLPLNPGFLTCKYPTGLPQERKERPLWGIKDAFKMSRSPSQAMSSSCIPLLEALPGVIFQNLWRGLFTAEDNPVSSEASMARLQTAGIKPQGEGLFWARNALRKAEPDK